MSDFKFVENEYTEKLENLIVKNQLPNQDLLWAPTNIAYLLVAQLYYRLANSFDEGKLDIVHGLIHSELTDTLIDTFTGMDLYSTQNIIIFNTDDGTICYDTDSTISQNKIIDQDGSIELLENLTYVKVNYMDSDYYLFID